MLKQAMTAMGGKGMPDPSTMDPQALEAAAKQMGRAMPGGKMPGGFGGMGGGSALPPGLSGFGKKK